MYENPIACTVSSLFKEKVRISCHSPDSGHVPENLPLRASTFGITGEGEGEGARAGGHWKIFKSRI